LHATLCGLLVVSEAQHLRAVPDAVVARVVEAHLDDELRAQGDPLELPPRRPTAHLAGPALAGLVGLEPSHQVALLAAGEARAVAHDAQAAPRVVEAEDQRP